MATKILIRRGPHDQIENLNQGEPGYVLDDNIFIMGNGTDKPNTEFVNTTTNQTIINKTISDKNNVIDVSYNNIKDRPKKLIVPLNSLNESNTQSNYIVTYNSLDVTVTHNLNRDVFVKINTEDKVQIYMPVIHINNNSFLIQFTETCKPRQDRIFSVSIS